MNILVTGGAGYVGSHVVKELAAAGHRIVVIDNLCKGHRRAVTFGKLVVGDYGDRRLVDGICKDHGIEAVVHLAAYSLVGESMEDPGLYYENNVCRGLQILETMIENDVRHLVFSSTAAVYGEPREVPITEEHPTDPTNTYGDTKLFFEQMLARYEQIYGMRTISLRYFNAAGADAEGEIGEDHDPETHLIPIIFEHVLGQREKLYIFGDDYPTPDGTCIRDYIHVSDLARAHLLALEALKSGSASGIYNLGNGEGYSVKEVIETAARVSGDVIEPEIGERRPGDPAILVASAQKAGDKLGWKPEHPELETILTTAWNWHRQGGFQGEDA